ncbi:selina-4(15),7(11)-diene synthase [Streptomyces albicerus]|uniref:selina-4(15),7(11)-diene synthase n=1 Tax=Streptomyces albicerus TaxID=2569859 RepID=UPI00124B75D9|nr:selina-4(15),7(11)-diene synthase [Streptomyces albicerus]
MTAVKDTLSIPPIYSPFLPAIHRSHDRIQQRSSVWAHQWNIGSPQLRSHLVRHDIGTFAARVLPDGDEDVVQILADFIIWLFGVDDGMCEEGPLGHRPGELSASLSRLLRVAQQPSAPMLSGDPLAEGLRDLRRRLAEHASPYQLARWVEGTRAYFFSLIWEAHHRSHGTTPGLNDYALIRMYNGAATAAEPFLEIARGYQLHPRERHHPVVEALAEMAFLIIGWDNDIFSFHKEGRGPHFVMNAVRVVHATRPGSLSGALSQVISHRDRATAHFLRIGRDHAPELTHHQHRYARDLAAFIRGNQDWGISSDRYINPADPADLPSEFTTVPTDDSPDPLPIPAVRGWWRL